jgi:predicted transcriptional regulator
MVALHKSNKNEKPLTEVELELMNVIWDLGECTVKDVQEALPAERNLAYTSVATIMKILEQKKIVKSLKKEKAHIFSSLVSRNDYEVVSLRHLTENVFKGNPTSMVMRLLQESDLSEEELKSIKQILNEKLKS